MVLFVMSLMGGGFGGEDKEILTVNVDVDVGYGESEVDQVESELVEGKGDEDVKAENFDEKSEMRNVLLRRDISDQVVECESEEGLETPGKEDESLAELNGLGGLVNSVLLIVEEIQIAECFDSL